MTRQLRRHRLDAPAPRAERVLVVASELPPGPGGIGAHAHAVATELQRQGRQVTVLGSQHYVGEDERTAFNSRSPVPVVTLPDGPDPARTALARAAAIRRVIRDTAPDVIIGSGGRLLWLVAPLARHAGVPLVAVAHGTELGWSGWKRSLARRAFDSATAVVAVSEFTAGLARAFGVSRPIDVIPNGADGDRFAPSAERRARFRAQHAIGDRPMVLTVGNVTERKGQHRVVDALPLLVRSVPDVVYVVVGRPTEADGLRRRAEALGVAEHLVLLGQLDPDEVFDAHAAADVFAMTSTSTGDGDVEGYGIAVVEAALSGVPAVVTRGTGAEEAVVDGATGTAVENRPEAIAEALGKLLSEPSLRRSWGRAAEATARKSGTWAHRAEQYGRVLDRTVSGGAPRIVVVSHTEHWRTSDGSVVGFGATTRELDQLATLASELVHVAPLHPGPPPGMALPARAPNLRLSLVPSAGGHGLAAKAGALFALPRWVWVINRECRRADVVHVRCPAGISMVALAVLSIRRRPTDRWVKYAGNWMPPERDALTYRIQRRWLRSGVVRAAVTVNGRWPGQPSWVHTFDNPTLTDDELARGRAAAESKDPGPPWRVVFSGRLEREKGADIAVDTVAELRRRGLDVRLDLIGDGPLRPWVEERIKGTGDAIRLHGWLRRDELEGLLARGHAMLLPTRASEGFPKVLAEAMAFGCVPVTSPVSSIGQTLAETGGAVIVEEDASWPDHLGSMLEGERRELVSECLAGTERFSYGAYLERVRTLALEEWGRHL